MKASRQAAAGVLLVVLVAGIILGSMVIAMCDWLVVDVLDPSFGETQMVISVPSLEADSPRFLTSAPGRWSETSTITQTITGIPTRTTSLFCTFSSSSTICPLPQDWQVFNFSASDSLGRLAAQYQVSTAGLLLANCLGNPIPAMVIVFYVPAKPPIVPPFTLIQVDSIPTGDSPTPTNTPHPG